MTKTKDESKLKAKITLDSPTSTSEDDSLSINNNTCSLDDTAPTSAMNIRKHSLKTLRRHHHVKKRLNNVHSQLIDKLKIEKIMIFEQNRHLAIEVDKQKQIVQMKTVEILEYQKESFELKEYILELQRENDMLVQAIRKSYDIFKPFFNSSSQRSSLVNNSTSRMSSTANESAKVALLSPLGVASESLSKMQQLAIQNAIKLQNQKQSEASKVKTNDVYDFDEDLENNSAQELQYSLVRTEHEVENTGRMEKIFEEDEEEEEDEADKDENEEEEVDEEIENVEVNDEDSNNSEENPTWITNKKQDLKKYEKKSKHVSFEAKNSALIEQGFTIYNDTSKANEEELTPKKTYYEQLENRPVFVNNLNKNKPKRILTPKHVNKSRNMVSGEDDLENDTDEDIGQEVSNEEIVKNSALEKENKRKSVKKSIDRRRSCVFNSLDASPNKDLNNHEPHIQPIEISNEPLDEVISTENDVKENDVEVVKKGENKIKTVDSGNQNFKSNKQTIDKACRQRKLKGLSEKEILANDMPQLSNNQLLKTKKKCSKLYNDKLVEKSEKNKAIENAVISVEEINEEVVAILSPKSLKQVHDSKQHFIDNEEARGDDKIDEEQDNQNKLKKSYRPKAKINYNENEIKIDKKVKSLKKNNPPKLKENNENKAILLLERTTPPQNKSKSLWEDENIKLLNQVSNKLHLNTKEIKSEIIDISQELNNDSSLSSGKRVLLDKANLSDLYSAELLGTSANSSMNR